MNRLVAALLVPLSVVALVARADAQSEVNQEAVVVVGGDLDTTESASIRSAVAGALRAASVLVSDASVPAPAQAELRDCSSFDEPAECFPATLTDQGIGRALVVTAKRERGPDGRALHVLTVRLLEAQPPRFAVRDAYCEVCTGEKLASAAARVASELVDSSAVQQAQTALDVRSTPTGALIKIDGTPVGATDMTVNLGPGAHVVELEKDGYESARREVVLVEKRTTQLAVSLTPAGGQRGDDRARASKIPLALVIGGSALAVAGVVLVAIDEDDATSPRGTLQPETYRDTATFGVVTGVAGVAAITAGVLWWKLASSPSSPVVQPTAGGAIVGVGGQF